MELKDKKCVPCEGGMLALPPAGVEHFRSQINSAWRVLDNKKLERLFTFKDFKEAISFMNQVAAIAESEGHHPDIFINYNKLTLTLWTHAIGGLSENDFILASKIDAII